MSYLLKLQSKGPLFEHLLKIFQKLVSILAIFAPVIETDKKNNIVLKNVLYIYYLIQFKENKVRGLIDLNNKVNAIILKYVLKIDLKICSTNVKA